MASTHVQHMQKALDQMNLQLHHVITDLTGLTGMTIVEAILGESATLSTGGTARPAGQGHPGDHRQVAGGRLSPRASVYAPPVVDGVPSLPRVDQGL